jgi:hypothetical protein
VVARCAFGFQNDNRAMLAQLIGHGQPRNAGADYDEVCILYHGAILLG